MAYQPVLFVGNNFEVRRETLADHVSYIVKTDAGDIKLEAAVTADAEIPMN